MQAVLKNNIVEIADLDQYNHKMHLGAEDKLFFMDYFNKNGIIPHLIADYGCADGYLLSLLPDEWMKLGIDENTLMIEKAKHRHLQNSAFTTDTSMSDVPENSVCLFSSVLHEVYSYHDTDYINRFWNNLINAAPEYIIIRDMATTVTNERSSDFDVWQIRNKADHLRLADFEFRYGKINQKRNMLHFLLKYRYTQHWARELNEDYFAVSAEEIINRLKGRYDVVHKDEYCLPFIQKTAEKDFGIVIQDPTHLKMILKRRGVNG